MKTWKKPMVLKISAEKLSIHIKAAARSMQCLRLEYR